MSGYQDVPMTRRRAQLLEEYASKLADMLEAAPNDKDLAEWVQSKIDRAAAAIQSAYHYLDQDDESELEKARVLKYDYRRPSKTRFNKKTGKREWDYFYTKKHGARVTRGAFEAGAAFRMTWKGRKGHFHIHHVKGDQVFITHDSRPDMEPIPVQADELRALLERQHKREVDQHLKRKTREVEEIKRRAHRGGLGLALHRLRQAAAQAGVSLPEQYQHKPKKTRAKVAETAREDRFETISDEHKEFIQNKTREFSRELMRGLIYEETKRGKIKSLQARLSGDAESAFVRLGLSALRGKEAASNSLRSFISGKLRGERAEEAGRKLSALLSVGDTVEDKQDILYKQALIEAADHIDEIAQGLSVHDKDFSDAEHRAVKQRTAYLRALSAEIETTARSTQTTPRDQLTSTAQQIIEDANQEHAERHDEHQEITRFELGEHVHTKTGAKLYTAKQTERVERDEYFRRLEIAKKHGGRYERRYVRGFVFKTAEDARAFALEVEGAAQEAPETSAEAVTPHDEHPGADNFETMPEVEAPRQGAERRRKEALIRLRFRQLLSLQDQETTETLDAEENRLNELSSKLLRTTEEAEQKRIEAQIQSLITEAREKVQRAEERAGEAAPELAPDPAQAIISDLMSLESDEIKQVEKYIEGYKAERYKRAQKDLYIKELSKLLGDAIAYNYESLSERYSEQAIVQTLERLEDEKNKPNLDNALVSPLLDKQPTAPARQALTETTERVTSDQTAEQATTRATPRPSEETLRGSGELDETVRANLQDRAQYLLRMPEDTTKTGMRSKAQKVRDGELLLIHRRLQSDAQERLGPTAPRFADYSQLVGMPRADQPENAETRAQFRTALKDAIRELEQATSGQVTKSARPLITYRAQLIQTVERLTAA